MTTTTTERRVAVNGIELFVREQGEGHPLLMVNGLGGNLEMWGEGERRLTEAARTITFDAPGTGRSSTPIRPLAMFELARTVWSLVDELGYERVDVLGFSLGGVIAQQLAREAPHRIRRLALVATGCGWGSVPGTLPALTLIALPWRYYSRRVYEQSNRLLGAADAHLGDRLDAQLEARFEHPPSLLGYAFQLWAGVLWSSLRWLPGVTIPTLVVAGAADQLVPPANSVQLAGLLPESRLHLLEGEGHLLLFDPESAAHDLLAGFFHNPEYQLGAAWTTGRDVSRADVENELGEAAGAQPFRAMSDTFRRLAQRPGPA